MKVSLIITTYNSPDFLRKTLDSVQAQDRPPDEVVVADDGSGGDTSVVIDTFARGAAFPVLHVWQENQGFRAARIRNKAINRSSGDYLILLDGDCILNRHFIADHCRLAEKGYFVQGKRVHVNREAVETFNKDVANSFSCLIKLGLKGWISNTHHLLRLPLIFSVSNRKLKGIKSCNMGCYRDDLFAVNGFNEDYVGWGNEDSDLACRFFKYGLSKKVHPFMAICFHLWHPTNKGLNNENIQLLQKAIASDQYSCRNGLIKATPV
ncbi:MAG: glycosyltransferase [Nitrospirae bacterium]|nr:MAG: glycosyltransferase [Nitrospirota bacterium]